MDNLRADIIHEVRTEHKAIAITFDDGPNPEYTPKFLALLGEYNAKATFYIIGQQREKYPEVVKLIHEQGHELGNHTYSHPHLSELSHAEQKSELQREEDEIAQLTGRKPTTFRPPFLDYDESVVELSKSLGYQMIGALNLKTEDWRQPGVEFILDQTRGHIRNGSILLFHDGCGDRSHTLEAIQILIPELVLQGYQLVTISELLQLGSNT